MRGKHIVMPYSPDMEDEWNGFVGRSPNGTFLHIRGFMDYHAGRFPDCSLIIKRNGKIRALLPATYCGDTVSSHAGLTYGGLITSPDLSTPEMLVIFHLLCNHLSETGYRNFIYKPVPHIYHTTPAEADIYALFQHNAELSARNLSSAIHMSNPPEMTKLRKRCISKAQRAGITVKENSSYEAFWDILTENLRTRHNVVPVHSLAEIELLASKFPSDIRLFTAKKDGKTVAGVLVFETRNVAHAQYIASSECGREHGALDLIFAHLLEEIFRNKEWFDFGISNENGGRILNEGLVLQKEGFGGRPVCYDTYTIKLSK